MNNVFFAFKRIHLSSLRLSRQMLGTVLTPARFDLMRAVKMHDDEAVLFFDEVLLSEEQGRSRHGRRRSHRARVRSRGE